MRSIWGLSLRDLHILVLLVESGRRTLSKLVPVVGNLGIVG